MQVLRRLIVERPIIPPIDTKLSLHEPVAAQAQEHVFARDDEQRFARHFCFLGRVLPLWEIGRADTKRRRTCDEKTWLTTIND